MSKEYPEKAVFMGHSGTHVRDGIYKVDEPFWVDIMEIVDSPEIEFGFGLVANIEKDDDTVEVNYFCTSLEDRYSLYYYINSIIEEYNGLYYFASIVPKGLTTGHLGDECW